MRSAKGLVVAAIAVAFALSMGPASATTGTIDLIAPWGNAAYDGTSQVTVTYSISASRAIPQSTIDAVQAAIDHWNNCLDSGLNSFSEFGFSATDTDCGTLPTNGHWRFAAPTSGAPLVKISIKKGGGVIAGQTFTKFDSSGFVAGDRVQISGSSFGVSNDQAVFNIAAHELGHVVGLGHSSTTSDDLMNPTINGMVDFGSCEINGVIALYNWLPSPLPSSPPTGPVTC